MAEIPDPSAPPATDEVVTDVIPAEDRGELIGDGWGSSEDTVIIGLGDATGFSIYRADASDGYEWSTLATLSVESVETDRWIGNVCVTEDGSKIGVVYGARTMTNEAELFDAGGWGAIIDAASGAVTPLGRGFSLAYFNPGCGAGNNIVMSAFADAGTKLVEYDALNPDSPQIIEVAGEITSAMPTAAGVVGATDGNLVAVGESGTVTVLANTTGTPYNLTASEGGGLAYLERDNDEARARFLPEVKATEAPAEFASAEIQDLELQGGRGGAVFVISEDKDAAADLPASVQVIAAPVGAQVSSDAELVLLEVNNEAKTLGADAAPVDPSASRPIVDVKAKHEVTGEEFSFKLDPSSAAALPSADSGASGARAAVIGDPHNAIEVESTCAIPRNDPANQAMQPKPRQVEWAVNQAVTGTLNVARAGGGYLSKAGLNGTTPQDLFPRLALDGGGYVPSQVMLGILAQESNLWQASRYTTPGVTGNPLIGNFYGNDTSDATFAWTPQFANADCGYGVAQVTDGMRKAGSEKPGEVALSPQKQRAVALDYATNIAAGLRILAQKWNQTRAAGLTVNGGNSKWLENWFYAVWAYNSGFYPQSDAAANGGAWGVGWSNNPANAKYKQNRTPFLETSSADAAKPQEWPYPEKVMGFASWSFETYEDATTAVPAFRAAWWSAAVDRTAVKPPLNLFCVSTVNNCNPGETNLPNAPGLTAEPAGPCAHKNTANQFDLKCWMHGPVEWKGKCESACGNELLRFYAGYAEQPDGNAFAPACTTSISPNAPMDRGLPAGSLIVDDTTSPSLRAGCTRAATQGSFQFTFGSGLGGYPAKIDTHQLGAGFNSHFYFAHTRKANSQNDLYGSLDVSGKWSLGSSLAGQWTRVFVHMPDHGAWTQQAKYDVGLGNGSVKTRVIPQRTGANDWISLGVFEMAGAPTVTLNNTTYDGDGIDDVAWDAVAFQPLPDKPDNFIVAMGDSFSSGEGSSVTSGADFYPESDNNGKHETATANPAAWTKDVEYNRFRNACHRSSEAWSRKAILSGASSTIGQMADAQNSNLDYHLVACSGALSEHILPYYSTGENLKNAQDRLKNAFGITGEKGKYREVSQLDSGFLDENTTLVTLSVGGNDAGFAKIIAACIALADCKSTVMEGDTEGLEVATTNRISGQVGPSVRTVLEQIHLQAPNARVLLMGYPDLFESGGDCVTVNTTQVPWLRRMSASLGGALKLAVDQVNGPAQPDYVVYGDTTDGFHSRNLCGADGYINRFVLPVTKGDDPIVKIFGDRVGIVSAQSVHPNKLGAGAYADVMESALGW